MSARNAQETLKKYLKIHDEMIDWLIRSSPKVLNIEAFQTQNENGK